MTTLVSKLQESISDDSIYKLGEVVFDVSCGNSLTRNERKISVRNEKSSYVRIIGDAFFEGPNGENLGTELEVGTSTKEVFPLSPSGRCFVAFGDKYSLYTINFAAGSGLTLYRKPVYGFNSFLVPTILGFTNTDFDDLDLFNLANARYINVANSNCQYDFSDVSLVSSIYNFNASSSNVYGDLDVFAGLGSLETLNLSETRFTGELSSLAEDVKLSNLNVGLTAVSGELEDLLDGLFSNGKVSGTLLIYLTSGQITYAGEPAPSGNYRFSFSSSGWERI